LSNSTKTFEHQLARNTEAVERFLVSVLGEEGLVEEERTPDRLAKAMRHAVLGGGKRFRPFLVMESAALFDVERSISVSAAAALECLHCYSLAHDDLPSMDNDLLRRGQPTVWAAYDEWTAILSGDALLTLAFEILARPETHPDAGVRGQLCLLLAQAGGRAGMVGGQSLDLEADKLGQPPVPDMGHVRRLQSMKTGALIRFACEAGVLLGGGRVEQRAALRSFGEHLGYAFQIADDLLDLQGSAETLGKATGKDADAGKATLASMMGIEATRMELKRVHAAAIDALSPFGSKAGMLKSAADFAIARSH